MDIEIRPEIKQVFKLPSFKKAIQEYDLDKAYRIFYNNVVGYVHSFADRDFQSLFRTCSYQLNYILKSIDIQPEKYLSNLPVYFYDSEIINELDLRNTHIEYFNIGAFNECNIETLYLPKTIRALSRGDFLNSIVKRIVFDMSLEDVRKLLEDSCFESSYPRLMVFGNDDSNNCLRYDCIENTWEKMSLSVRK